MGADQASSPLGMVVRRHRMGAGLTQHELAERAGISVRGLRELEQGRIRQPRATSVRSLADALALSPAQRDTLLALLAGTDAECAQLRIAVLGPIALCQDGAPVDMPSQRQRALLGLLALHRGQVVQTSDIIDMLWGEQPRRTARNLVSMYVSQLRTLLGTAGRSLRSAHAGYALDLADEQLDLAQFDDLAMRAQTAQSAQRPEQAMELYARALRCWRGPVLADAGDRLRQHPAAVAATQRRIAATVAAADAAVAIGAADQVVSTLRKLSHEEPLHEPVHARLMVALAATGEQATALQVFAELRGRLADELGVEPGPDVQAAHVRILRGQVPATGRTAIHGDDPMRVPVPAQLPAMPRHFTGRRGHLDTFDAWLAHDARDTSAVFVIAGTAGVGKTTLAVRWAHRVATKFPDGQLYVNLRGFDPADSVMDPGEAVRGFLDALDVPPQRIPQSLDAQVGLYRSLLANRRILILLDNARDAEQLRPLLPTAPGCVAVVTSRNQLCGLVATEGAHALTIDVMSTSEARQLLADRLGADTITAQSDAAERIISRCERLPLALAIVCARATTQAASALATLADELDEAGIEAFDGGDPATDIRTVFSWSYRTLQPDTAHLFRLLGLHPGPDISAAAAASLIGRPLPQVRPSMRELTRAHLLAEQSPGRYAFHDLLRAHAIHLVHSSGGREAVHRDRSAALGRLYTWYLGRTAAAMRLVYPTMLRLPVDIDLDEAPFTDTDAAMAWLNQEIGNLVAVVEAAGGSQHRARSWQLADQLRGYFFVRRDVASWLATGRAGLAAADTAADPRAQAAMHQTIGQAHWAAGRHRLAADAYRRGIRAARRSGWLVGEAYLSHNLGLVHAELGRLDEAQQLYQQALNTGTGPEFDHIRAVTLNDLGVLCHERGQLTKAAGYLQAALRMNEGAARRPSAIANRGNLGMILRQLEQFDAAREHLDAALAYYRQTGSTGGELSILDELSQLHRQRGEWTQAVDTATEALRLARRQRNLRAQAGTLTTFGFALLGRHAVGEALARFDESLMLSREHGYQYFQAQAHIGRAEAILHHGRPEDANRAAGQAVDIAARNTYRTLHAEALIVQAKTAIALGDPATAENHCHAADPLLRATNLPGQVRDRDALRALIENLTRASP